jgi:hypothetical protein
VPFTPKDWRNAAAHDGGGDTSTPLSAAGIEDLEVRVTDYSDIQGGPLFNVKDPTYGALGDGGTDDTAAILAACADAKEHGTVYFPSSSGEYMVSSTLPGDVDYLGQGMDGEGRPTIKATAGFNGTNQPGTGGDILIDVGADFYHERKTMRNLCLHGNDVTGLHLLASSDAAESGNPNWFFHNVAFRRAGQNTYAIYSEDGGNNWLAGTVFMQCHWYETSHAIKPGVNADELTFLNCRWEMQADTDATATTKSAYISISGIVTTMQDCWVVLGSTGGTVADFNCFCEVTTNGQLRVQGIWFEEIRGDEPDLDYLFVVGDGQFEWDGGWTQFTALGSTMADLQSLTKKVLTKNANDYHCVKNIRGRNSDYTLGLAVTAIDYYAGGGVGGTGYVEYQFGGIAGWNVMIVNGSDNGAVIHMIGFANGLFYHHYTDDATWNTAPPNIIAAITEPT